MDCGKLTLLPLPKQNSPAGEDPFRVVEKWCMQKIWPDSIDPLRALNCVSCFDYSMAFYLSIMNVAGFFDA
jgi:hypothetical protein